MNETVLVVEDDPLLAIGIRLVLEKAGYTVVGAAADEEAAVALTQAHDPAVVVSDVTLRRGNGVSASRRYGPRALVFLTGHADLLPCMRPPACLYAAKPIAPAALVAAVSMALAWQQGAQLPSVLPAGFRLLTSLFED